MITFTISPGMVKPDQPVMITTAGGTLGSVGVALVNRSVGACSVSPPRAP